jgi:hypothetical protein
MFKRISLTRDQIGPGDHQSGSLDQLFSRPALSSQVTVGLIIGIISLAIAARLLPGPRTIDDSYITYRYARNILAGNGFVYNPGERVLGTTTPLYTILLTLTALFAGGTEAPFAIIAMVINAMADAATCWLLYRLGRRLGSPLAGIGAAAAWSIAPFSVTFAVGGLETSLYVFLLIAITVAYLNRRFGLTALLGALALLTRPDALILLLPLGLDRLYQAFRNRLPGKFRSAVPIESSSFTTKEIVAFALPTFLWFSFAAVYFGSPIPHSIAAKSVAYRLPSNLGLFRLVQHYATPFMGHLTFGNTWIGIGLILFPFLSVLGIRKAVKKNARSWSFMIYPWLYFVLFAGANPLIFRWYLTPPLPLYILSIMIGANYLLADVFSKWRFNPNQKLKRLPMIASITILILIPFGLLLNDWTLKPDHGLATPAPEMAWYEAELIFVQAAEILEPHLTAQSVLAAGDVGVLGFYTPARILDLVGLNSPESVDYYPLAQKYYVINYAIPPKLIFDYLPDYLVMFESYGREGLLKDPNFWENYYLLDKIPTDLYDSDGFLIFSRSNPKQGSR